jgi:hypothetical protein
MNSPALIVSKSGQIRVLPTCQECGRPIVAPGICVECAKLPHLVPIRVVRVAKLVNPEDLRE